MIGDRMRHFIPDLPGSGSSERTVESLGIPELADWLVAYCDAAGVDRAVFVGNSLGCVTVIELAVTRPDLVAGIVLVSPAGGPNNQPMGRAIGQMARDAPREPWPLTRLATADYLRFGVRQGVSLFRAMTRYPTLDRLALLAVPMLVVVGRDDPLVDVRRVMTVLDGVSDVTAVVVDGAHALNFTRPVTVASVVTAWTAGDPIPDDEHGIDVLFDRR
jgi:pimeloyl-ACP methyl ester carboxylesterase